MTIASTTTTIKSGDHVKLHYTTYAADGCVIETSVRREPLEFVAGENEIVSGLNRAVIGMKTGERRRIAVGPEQAFGFRDSRLQQPAPRIGFLSRVDAGDQLTTTIGGCQMDVWIKSTNDDEVILDANHPLAGESLVYEIEIVSMAPQSG